MAPPIWLSGQPQFGPADADSIGPVSFFEDQLGASAVSSWWDGSSRKNPGRSPDYKPGPQSGKNQPPKETIHPPEAQAEDDSFPVNPSHRPKFSHYEQYDDAAKPKTKGKGSSKQKGQRFRTEETSFYQKPNHRAPSTDSDRYAEPPYDQAGEIPEYYTPESIEKSPIRQRPSLLDLDTYSESGYPDQVSEIPEYYSPEPIETSPLHKNPPPTPPPLKLNPYPDQGGQIPEYYAPESLERYPIRTNVESGYQEQVPKYYGSESVEKSSGRKRRPSFKLDTYPESGSPEQAGEIPEYYAPESVGKSSSRKRRPSLKLDTYPESGNPEPVDEVPESYGRKPVKKPPTRKRPSKVNSYPKDRNSDQDPIVFHPESDVSDQRPYPLDPSSGHYEDPSYQKPYQAEIPPDDPFGGASGNKPFKTKTYAESEDYGEPSKKIKYDSKHPSHFSYPSSGDNYEKLSPELPPPYKSNIPEFYYEDPISETLDELPLPAPGYDTSRPPEIGYESADPATYHSESPNPRPQRPKWPLKEEANFETENIRYDAGDSGDPDYIRPESNEDVAKRRRKPQPHSYSGKKSSGDAQYVNQEEAPLLGDHVKDESLPDENLFQIGHLLPARPLLATNVDQVQEITDVTEVPPGNHPSRRRRPNRPKIQTSQEFDPHIEEPLDVSFLHHRSVGCF